MSVKDSEKMNSSTVLADTLELASQYLREHYFIPNEQISVSRLDGRRMEYLPSAAYSKEESLVDDAIRSAEKLLREKKTRFVDTLLKMIDASGMTDAQVYNKARLNRAHFNKIKNKDEYPVTKTTAVALGLALGLSRGEMETFLKSAGYALSDYNKFDVLISFCIDNHIYNIDDVNDILDHFDAGLLGASTRD